MDRWRAPPSHSTVTTTCPGPRACATLTAPTQFSAALLPTNRPSFLRPAQGRGAGYGGCAGASSKLVQLGRGDVAAGPRIQPGFLSPSPPWHPPPLPCLAPRPPPACAHLSRCAAISTASLSAHCTASSTCAAAGAGGRGEGEAGAGHGRRGQVAFGLGACAMPVGGAQAPATLLRPQQRLIA